MIVEVARAFPSLAIVLVGPDSLSDGARRELLAEPNVALAGPRSYEEVPAYLQHADVVVVPHLVNEFTESLDPIKAYECLAVGVPTVATPVAGFRGLEAPVCVAARNQFARAVADVLRAKAATRSIDTPTWQTRVGEFEHVLSSIVS